MKEKIRNGAALVVILLTMLAADLAFGEDPGRCYGAYRVSWLTEQQMTFDQFRDSYAGTLCAPEGHSLQAARGATRLAGGRQPSGPRERRKER